jgi:Fe-S-cluster containining protein
MAMTEITKLNFTDKLPLTCSRTGTCCHGKLVLLNPWELANLAKAKKLSTRDFRDQYCDFGGICLRFDGAPGWKGLTACSQYVENWGCSVHQGRPLVCRLYPLGRQKQSGEVLYIYNGKEFPCLEGCSEVLDLPQLSVSEYISGQEAKSYENAQDAYLEMMQDLADIAFSLLLESGLAESGDRKTLKLWRKMGCEEPQLLAERLGSLWLDRLMLPSLNEDLKDPLAFCKNHYELLLTEAQNSFGMLDDFTALSEASGIIMGLALHLGRSLGAQPSELAEHWISTAKMHGARD